MTDPIEKFWNDILSKEPELIKKAFTPLSEEDKESLLSHLQRMSTEEGWHPLQVESANAALKVLT